MSATIASAIPAQRVNDRAHAELERLALLNTTARDCENDALAKLALLRVDRRDGKPGHLRM